MATHKLTKTLSDFFFFNRWQNEKYSTQLEHSNILSVHHVTVDNPGLYIHSFWHKWFTSSVAIICVLKLSHRVPQSVITLYLASTEFKRWQSPKPSTILRISFHWRKNTTLDYGKNKLLCINALKSQRRNYFFPWVTCRCSAFMVFVPLHFNDCHLDFHKS